jgi:thiamine biosynthesis lipoprotein
MFHTRLGLLALLTVVATCQAAGAIEPTAPFVFHHDHILGTSLEIQVQTATESDALAAETRILGEISRLSKIFSTYDPDSEFSRWQQSVNVATKSTPELLEILVASERWNKSSDGAFQPGVEVLSRLWKQAQQRGALPSQDELSTAINAANQEHWRLNVAEATITRLSNCPLTLNAIAKGAIVEWACRTACESASVKGLIINLGGDLRIYGDAVQEVSIADPRNDSANAAPIARIFVTNRAIATSGNYRRGFQINGQSYSHIINPRTGQPVSDVISATVVAQSSTDADAIATICNVLPVQDSLKLVRSLNNVECLLIAEDGRQFHSDRWDDLTSPRLFRFASSPSQLLAFANPNQKDGESKPAAAKTEEKATPELHELLVKFELDRPAGGQYRRPYVAVWLEDEDEFPVRTAILWMQTKSPGPRWHRDLLRWYRNDGARKIADGTQLIGTVSAATRGPGEYKASFDGLDDGGKALKPGKYTLYIEVAREHGTYQLIRHPLTLGKEPIAETKLKSNVEVKSASVEYRPRESKPAATEAK